MRKKGALNLTISAIVILILALSMLGLGLTFMRNIFGKATGEFEEISGEVQKQMINQMKQTSKIVDLSGAVYKIKPGEKKMAYIAFKNTANTEKDFMITGIDGNSLSDATTCGDGKEVFLEYKKTPTTVQPGATLVLPMNIKADSSANKDSCFFEIMVDSDYEQPTGTCIFSPNCGYGPGSPRGLIPFNTAAGFICHWGSISEPEYFDMCVNSNNFDEHWIFKDEGQYVCLYCKSDGSNCDGIQDQTEEYVSGCEEGSKICDCKDYLNFNKHYGQSIQLTVNIEN